MRTERAASREQAADRLRDDIQLPGALRWLRRRRRLVRQVLQQVIGFCCGRKPSGAGNTGNHGEVRERSVTNAASVSRCSRKALNARSQPARCAPAQGWESQGWESHFALQHQTGALRRPQPP